MLKPPKTTFPNKPFDYDCVTLYVDTQLNSLTHNINDMIFIQLSNINDNLYIINKINKITKVSISSTLLSFVILEPPLQDRGDVHLQDRKARSRQGPHGCSRHIHRFGQLSLVSCYPFITHSQSQGRVDFFQTKNQNFPLYQNDFLPNKSDILTEGEKRNIISENIITPVINFFFLLTLFYYFLQVV